MPDMYIIGEQGEADQPEKIVETILVENNQKYQASYV